MLQRLEIQMQNCRERCTIMTVNHTAKKIAGKGISALRYAKNKGFVFKLISNIFLITVSFVFIYPFLYMISTSVKSYYDLFDKSVNWIAHEFTFSNYVTAFKFMDYPRHATISLAVTVLAVALHLAFDSFIAYGLARYKFPGRSFLTVIMVLSIMIPMQVVIIPQYLEFYFLGWKNTYLPIIIPIIFGFGLKSGLFIFIFRQFFLGLPKSLEEAAKIDGCSFIKTFFLIVVPTARTSMLVCGVMAMVWHWNDYFAPSIYLDLDESWPLPSMLPALNTQYESMFVAGTGAGNTPLNDLKNLELAQNLDSIVTEATVAAGIFLVVLPIILVYIFLQKQFVQGIERTGIVE